MTVDSFHRQIEKSIRKRCYLYDFNDYAQVVNLCGDSMIL